MQEKIQFINELESKLIGTAINSKVVGQIMLEEFYLKEKQSFVFSLKNISIQSI